MRRKQMSKLFAVIEDGIVENVVYAESLEMAIEATGKHCVDATDKRPFIGYAYDEENDIFDDPKPEFIEEPKAIEGEVEDLALEK